MATHVTGSGEHCHGIHSNHAASTAGVMVNVQIASVSSWPHMGPTQEPHHESARQMESG